MKIQIPKIFKGKPVKGSLEKVLAELDKAPISEAPQIQPPVNEPYFQDYIYVPSINLYVAKQRTNLGLNWYQVHETLQSHGLKMPAIYEFKEFIKYLKQNPNGVSDASQQEISQILDDILTVRAPWRAEWLDAKFTKQNNKIYLNSAHKIINGQLVPQNKELLVSCLMEDKTPGIDLDDWLNNSTKQSLPAPKAKKGELYYWSPRENYVARLGVGSGRVGLGCDRAPDGTFSSLGVFCEFSAKLKTS